MLSFQTTRREFLRLGVAGLGLTATAQAAPTLHGPGWGQAKSVLIVFAGGGQSQLE